MRPLACYYTYYIYRLLYCLHLPKSLAQLVGTRRGFAPATDAFQPPHHFFRRHAFHQPGNALQVSVASSRVSHVLHNAVFHGEGNARAASALRLVQIFRHCAPLFFFRFHVGINRLHIIKLLQAFHHLVDGLTLFRGHVLQVVRNISKFTADILKAAFLQMLLNGSIALGNLLNTERTSATVRVVLSVNVSTKTAIP